MVRREEGLISLAMGCKATSLIGDRDSTRGDSVQRIQWARGGYSAVSQSCFSRLSVKWATVEARPSREINRQFTRMRGKQLFELSLEDRLTLASLPPAKEVQSRSDKAMDGKAVEKLC